MGVFLARTSGNLLRMYGPFAAYIQPYKKRMLLGLLALVLAQAATALIPLRLEEAVNSIDPAATAVEQQALYEKIQLYALQIAGLALGIALGRYVMRRILGFVSNRIEYDIRTYYFAHLLKLPLSYYQQHRTGDLMSRATNDLIAVHIFFTYCLRSLADASLSLAFSLALMCTIHWQLTLIVLLPLPVLGLFLIRMTALVHTRFKVIQEFFGHMSNFIQENLSGIRVVKSYAQGPAQIAAFDELNLTYLQKNQHLIHIRAIYYPVFFLMASIGLGLTLWFGGRAVVDGDLAMGGFVAFNLYLTMLIRPFSWMGWLIDRSQRALVAMRRINEVVEIRPEIEDRSLAPSVREESAGHIQFRGLSFAYNDTLVLQDINLDIPAGSTLGIIGRVGSGKTTLARLIPRLIQTDQGHLLIDGRPVEKWPLEQLRCSIGYVSQMPFLFSDTIRANVSYGVEQADEEQVRAAAEQAQIKKDVEAFGRGFDTVIGERGVTLSGGQKQRTTLARALIRLPSILILDDALSAVDTQTEEAILGHLRQIMKGRTTLLIAHRISTLRDADHIIVLDQGRITEQGRHEKLVELGGLYAELFHHQRLAAELESL